jgi:hypothetical protein
MRKCGKIFVERGWPQMTIWFMLIACWIPKATNTHSSWVTLITFPLQQWLHERASTLRYAYIAYLVIFVFIGTETKILITSHAYDIGVYFPGVTVGGM